uniref:Reverse transcriptase/retrotransposon-derived protein RNase H-like domain-containing protein n=1 Tax=Romanomermis culicivorax TaxID=13658 RepID=A0A915JPV9_ROMCU
MAKGMEKFPDFEHPIMLMDDAIPIAQQVRQVLITRHAAVEKEVKQMVTDDIWERDLADHAEPLQHLTRMSEQIKFEESDECTMAFNKLKSLLTNDLQLAIFDPDPRTILAANASNIGLGAF